MSKIKSYWDKILRGPHITTSVMVFVAAAVCGIVIYPIIDVIYYIECGALDLFRYSVHYHIVVPIYFGWIAAFVYFFLQPVFSAFEKPYDDKKLKGERKGKYAADNKETDNSDSTLSEDKAEKD